MANSNTNHSKKLRQETSKKFNKENLKRLEMTFNINNDSDMKLFEILKNLSKDRKNVLYKLLIND